ncbi:MAG: DUF2116 family Zn-ribbon domain-containing protein [Thermoplasmatota archaeon]
MAPAKIPQHKHCMVCGKAIRAREQYCSEECEREWARASRTKRNLQMVLYISMAVMIVVLVLSMTRGGG